MKKYNFDIVVIGGGIAGVWTHSLLKKAGYSCCLLEKKTIGGEQSLVSQGIIHKGMKYLLGKFIPDIAGNLLPIAKLWDAALSGKGELDLSDTEIYTEQQLIWQSQSLLSSFFISPLLDSAAKKIFQSQVQKLKPLEYPFWLEKNKAAFWVKEKVINSHSLFKNFYNQQKENYYQASEITEIKSSGDFISLKVGDVVLRTQKIILAAGMGNIALAKKFQIKQRIQLRPLKMLAVKFFPAPKELENTESQGSAKIYGHCVGAAIKPLFSISTHKRKDNGLVYYLGGKIAEDGVNKEDNGLIAEAKKLLKKNTGLKLKGAEWQSIKIDRAEPEQKRGRLPDESFVKNFDKTILCFPVKLALAPQMAWAVREMLKKEKIKPRFKQSKIQELPKVKLKEPFWETLF